jgi:hypothetical protein
MDTKLKQADTLPAVKHYLMELGLHKGVETVQNLIGL